MKIFVLEVFCQKCEINYAMQVRAEWVKKYWEKGYNIMGFFDATAAQEAVYLPVIIQAAEDNHCPNIPMPKHQEGDKHNRIATGITNVLFRKILFWDESLKTRSKKDYEAFMKQILAFERGTSSNDDAPDTLERGITLIQTYFGYSESKGSTKPAVGKRSSSRKRRI